MQVRSAFGTPLICAAGHQIIKNQIRRKISEVVKAAVFNAFSADFQLETIDTLSRYGIEEHEREPDRVQLAILNLSEGDLDRLKDLVTEAKKDYRNILYWNDQAEKL